MFLYDGRIKTCLDVFQSGHEPNYRIGLIIGSQFEFVNMWVCVCVWERVYTFNSTMVLLYIVKVYAYLPKGYKILSIRYPVYTCHYHTVGN